jgi:fructosamine-3-kinase
MPTIAHRAERLLGTSVISTTPVAGGDVCTATRLRLSDGRSALVKTRPHPPASFFETEAAGLTWLAEADAVATPAVLAHDGECLILGWVEPGRSTPESAVTFGRALARLHASGADGFGAERDGFIGVLPLPNGASPTWPEFYATRRVLPYLKLAVDRGQIGPTDAADVERAVRRIVEIAGPDEPPARLHGDLWNGNVIWTREGDVHVIDPAAHGGHRETDLAMLTLFGLPQLQRAVEAYQAESPLADGWEDRVALHQLFPLLVHTCMFGSSYGARAGTAARQYL